MNYLGKIYVLILKENIIVADILIAAGFHGGFARVMSVAEAGEYNIGFRCSFIELGQFIAFAGQHGYNE